MHRMLLTTNGNCLFELPMKSLEFIPFDCFDLLFLFKLFFEFKHVANWKMGFFFGCHLFQQGYIGLSSWKITSSLGSSLPNLFFFFFLLFQAVEDQLN
jgi:hypothetical protein